MELIFIIAAGALALSLILAFIAWRVVFFSPIPRREDAYVMPKGGQYQTEKERMLGLIREFDALPYEPVSIRAHDGLELFGRYYHVREGAPLQIQCHGYHGTALRDFCGGNKLAREAGQNTLVIDQRAHGKSQGHTISFGINERLDCLAWARYAAERFGEGTPIVLAGVSMGAATVLMASELELPENVRCIIADCPYSSPERIIRKVCGEMHFPQRLVYPFIALGARLFGGFSIAAASALEAVGRCRLPVLLIHGEADRFVPCDMSRELAGACASRVRLETFPGAGHGLSYILDAERYGEIIGEFLSSCGIE